MSRPFLVLKTIKQIDLAGVGAACFAAITVPDYFVAGAGVGAGFGVEKSTLGASRLAGLAWK
jgi:hypothetical protein